MSVFAPRRIVAVRPALRCRLRHSVAPAMSVRRLPVMQANPAVEEFYNLTEQEIEEQVLGLKKELFDLRHARAMGESIKTHLFKQHRKKAAQLLTVKRKKEIEKGINKRESRKIEKEKLLNQGLWVR